MLSSILLTLFVGLACTVLGFIAGVYAERLISIPLWQREDKWSIGIYKGDSPLELSSPPGTANPVLTAGDVTTNGMLPTFVADPFIIRQSDRWYMFLEVMDEGDYTGKIALATSPDGLSWSYDGIVLREPWHLSYPCVFEWNGDYYMIPESGTSGAVRLYRASTFPTGWEIVCQVLHGAIADATPFRHSGIWYLFASDTKSESLRLFVADELIGPWAEHPLSPLIDHDRRIARPAGRVVEWNGRLIRYAQDCAKVYGNAVNAFEITELTPTRYSESEMGTVLRGSGSGWNADGMHHVDSHQLADGSWIACVDGCRRRMRFRFKW
jgi:hypothetical protein